MHEKILNIHSVYENLTLMTVKGILYIIGIKQVIKKLEVILFINLLCYSVLNNGIKMSNFRLCHNVQLLQYCTLLIK